MEIEFANKLIELIETHDVYHMMSDDYNVYITGNEEKKVIDNTIAIIPNGEGIVYYNYIIEHSERIKNAIEREEKAVNAMILPYLGIMNSIKNR